MFGLRPEVGRLFIEDQFHARLQMEFFPQLGRDRNLIFAADRGLHGETVSAGAWWSNLAPEPSKAADVGDQPLGGDAVVSLYFAADSCSSFSVFPVASCHSVRPLALRPNTNAAASDGELNV